MTLKEFHNALRILRCIDGDELYALGISATKVSQFLYDPFDWLIKANDIEMKLVWGLIEDRQDEEVLHGQRGEQS